jgi:hypothetical protein
MRTRNLAFLVFCVSLRSAVWAQTPSGRLSADTPKTTVLGNAFIAPRDWCKRPTNPSSRAWRQVA